MTARRLALALGLALFALTPAARSATPAAEPLAPPSTWIVGVFQEGQAETLDAAQWEDARDDRALRHLWVWSNSSPPRRIERTKSLVRDVEAALSERTDTLAIQRILPAERSVDAPEGGPDVLWLVAAPAAMWGEVPESLLPRWPVTEESVKIPADSGEAWRLRLWGEELGSWWLEVPPGRTSVEVSLESARTLRTRIVGDDGAEPEDPRLTVMTAGRGEQRVVALYERAAETGRVEIPALPDREKVSFVATADGHLPWNASLHGSDLPARIELEAGREVRGEFIDPSGDPIEGVAVRADGWLGTDASLVASRASASDASGAFALTALPRGEISLRAAREGFVPFAARIEEGFEDADLGRIEMIESSHLEVLVVDPEGNPVPDASVVATGSQFVAREERTDGLGRALLDDVPPGTFELAVEAEGFSRSESTASAPGSRRIELTPTFRVSGRLLREDETPVVRGSVRVQDGNSYFEQEILDGGRFELSLPPDRRLELTFRSAASREARISLEPGEPGEHRSMGDVIVSKGVSARGRVVSAADLEPVAGARIWLPRPGEAGEVVSWAQGDLLTAQSDEEGRFELSGLGRQPARLRVDAPNHARAHVEVVPPDEASTVDLGEIEVAAGADVRVRLEAEAGRAASGRAEARIDLTGRWLEVDMLRSVFVEQEALLRNVPPGRARLTVVQGEDVLCDRMIEVDASGHEVEIVCDPHESLVTGLVVLGTSPAHGGSLTWMPEAPEAPGLIVNQTTPLGSLRQRTFGAGRPSVRVEVDASGYFSSRRLLPGAWEVVYSPLVGSATPPLDVRIHDVETPQNLKLEFQQGVLQGMVEDGDGRRVAGARVTEVESGAFTITDSRGEFNFQGLQPGLHRLWARHGDAVSQTKVVEVVEGRPADPVTLVLEDDRAADLTVAITAPDGEPGAGAFVFLRGDDGSEKLLTANSRGRVVTTLAPAGPKRVSVAAFHEGHWAFLPWRTLSSHEVLRVDFVDTGSLEIASRSLRGPLQVAYDEWDLGRLLRRIGLRPELDPARSLNLSGLPAGVYLLGRDGEFRAAEVFAGEVTSVELP